MAAWSYSALDAFENCPKRFYHTRVSKDTPDPPGPEALFGTRVHKALEERIGAATPLADTFACYEPYAAKVVSLVKPGGVLRAEQKIALTRDLKPTGYFAKDVWFRAVLDFSIRNNNQMIIGDWKAGKRKPLSQQLELSAAAAAAIEPEVTTFKCVFIWLNEKLSDISMFTREQATSVWEKFLPRVARIDEAHQTGEWPAKPSGLCRRYCPVKTCKHCGV
jgi:hypothetical protein